MAQLATHGASARHISSSSHTATNLLNPTAVCQLGDTKLNGGAQSKAASEYAGHRAAHGAAGNLTRGRAARNHAATTTAAKVLVQEEQQQQTLQPEPAVGLCRPAETECLGPADQTSNGCSSDSASSKQQLNKQFVKALRHVLRLQDITIALNIAAVAELDAQSVTALGSALAKLVPANPPTDRSSLLESASPAAGFSFQAVTNGNRTFQRSPQDMCAAALGTQFTSTQPSHQLEMAGHTTAVAATGQPALSASSTSVDPLPKVQAYALRVWAPLIQAVLNDMDGFGLAACLHTAVQLRLHAPQVIEPLLHACMLRVTNSTPRVQATMLWSAAQLSSCAPPPQPWLKRWAHASYRRLPQYSCQDLAMVGSAMAQLKWSPPAAWALQLSARLAETTAAAAAQSSMPAAASLTAAQSSMSAAAAQSSMPAAATQQQHSATPPCNTEASSYSERGATTGIATTAAHADNLSSAAHSGSATNAAPAVDRHALDALRCVGCTVWGMARVGVVPPAEVLDSCLKHATQLLQVVIPHCKTSPAVSRTLCASLAMLLYGLLTLQYQPSPLFLKAFLQASSQCMYAAQLKELCVWAMSLSSWRVNLNSNWMTCYTSVTHARLPHATSQALVLLLDAYAQLSYPPPAAWMHTWESRLSRCLHHFTPEGTAQTIAALGSLGYRPSPHVLHALWSRLLPHARHIPAKRWFPALLGATMIGAVPQVSRLQDGFGAGTAFVLQRVVVVSREKLAHCQAVNVAHLAWACALWCQLDQDNQAGNWAIPAPDDSQQPVDEKPLQAMATDAAISLLPSLLAAARQKVRLASITDLASLLQALAALCSSSSCATANQQWSQQSFHNAAEDDNLTSDLTTRDATSTATAASSSAVSVHHSEDSSALCSTIAATHEQAGGTTEALEAARPRLQTAGGLHMFVQPSELQPLLHACVANMQTATLEQLVSMLSSCSVLGVTCCSAVASSSSASSRGTSAAASGAGGRGIPLFTQRQGQGDIADDVHAESVFASCNSTVEDIQANAGLQQPASEQDGLLSTQQLVHCLAMRCFQLLLEQQQEASVQQQRFHNQDSSPGNASDGARAGLRAVSVPPMTQQATEKGMRSAVLSSAAATWQRASFGSAQGSGMALAGRPVSDMPLFVRAWFALLESGFIHALDSKAQQQACTALYAAAEQFAELQAYSLPCAQREDSFGDLHLHAVLLDLETRMPHEAPEGWLCDCHECSNDDSDLHDKGVPKQPDLMLIT